MTLRNKRVKILLERVKKLIKNNKKQANYCEILVSDLIKDTLKIDEKDIYINHNNGVDIIVDSIKYNFSIEVKSVQRYIYEHYRYGRAYIKPIDLDADFLAIVEKVNKPNNIDEILNYNIFFVDLATVLDYCRAYKINTRKTFQISINRFKKMRRFDVKEFDYELNRLRGIKLL